MSLPDDLMAPGLELRQTHISWVYLSSTEVWKVKRPVDLGFLDFTTIEKRREACENEVALNRRLAPSVYLGVVPVRRSRSDGLSFEGAGEVVDWAVHMKRLPERDRADLRLADGRMSDDDIEAIARRLAAFHERSRHDERIRRFGSIDVIEKNVRENFEQVESSIRDYVSDDQVDEIESWQIRFLRDRRTTFEARVEDERIRDGHGDLRLEHVYLTDAGQIAIIDCIEFNERFRFADVCADVVFLAMDLAYSGRVDVAERFVAL